MTHPDFRNRGYCTTVINELMKFNRSGEDYPLYLFTSNPAALRIYSGFGFSPFEGDYQAFSAWKEIQFRL